MNTAAYREVTAGMKGNERLVLALIAMCADEGETADVDALARDTGLCAKQVLRIAARLKAEGRINVEGGEGRAPYVFTLASANGDKMSSQDSQDNMSEQAAACENNMSSLSDVGTNCPDNESRSGDKLSGTPVAPYSDIRTSTDTPQPTVEGADAPPPSRPSRKVIQHPSAKSESDHQRLMRELAKRLGGIADGAKQGKWARWLLTHGYSVDECVECLDDLTAQDWRDTRVDWLEVSKQIGAWKARKESENSREAAPPARTAIARGGIQRPNVSARTERQNRNAAALLAHAADKLASARGVRGGGGSADS